MYFFFSEIYVYLSSLHSAELNRRDDIMQERRMRRASVTYTRARIVERLPPRYASESFSFSHRARVFRGISRKIMYNHGDNDFRQQNGHIKLHNVSIFPYFERFYMLECIHRSKRLNVLNGQKHSSFKKFLTFNVQILRRDYIM